MSEISEINENQILTTGLDPWAFLKSHEAPKSEIDTIAKKAIESALSAEEKQKKQDLDPAQETIKAGLAFEKNSADKLAKMEAESNKNTALIDLILDLSKELAGMNEAQPIIPEKARSIIAELKKQGIDLINIEEKKAITKEQFATLKTNISSHLDKLRTNVQQIFTKMQTLMQSMSSINDSVKKMESSQTDLIRKVLERSIKR
jgi:hypothetical protein